MNDKVLIVTMMSLSFVFMVVGAWLFMYREQRLVARGLLCYAAGTFTQLVLDVLLDQMYAAAYNAAFTALALWLWWNKGGGDGLKRRLKSWSQSLRRTPAPQTA